MRLQKQLFVFALCLCLLVVVSAHSGKTDSQGGHYDRDSGGYHYHHGYPAHQHTDKDGDGVLDCPYLFDDKTVSDSDDTEQVKKDNSKNSKDYSWLFPILGCFILYGVVLLIDEIKWRVKK